MGRGNSTGRAPWRAARQRALFTVAAGACSALLGTLLACSACADGGASKASATQCPPECPEAAKAAPGEGLVADTAPKGPLDGPNFEPSRVGSVLGDARFEGVRAAIAAGEYGKAAAELAGLVPKVPAGDRAPLFFRLGRLRALAGDHAGAAKAYDAAAALPYVLADYARFAAAGELSGLGDFEGALARADAVPANLPFSAELELLRADARRSKGDLDEAAKLYRAYLERGKRAGWSAVSLRFARMLLGEPGKPIDEARAEEVLRIARRVRFEGPRGHANEALSLEKEALAALPAPRRKQAERLSLEDRVSEARGRLGAGQTKEALKLLDALVASFSSSSPLACEAASLRGSALMRLRRRPEASKAYGRAVELCKGQEKKPEALYNAGKAAMSADKPELSAERYERLEKEHGKHRLADDARLLRAKALLELGKPEHDKRALALLAAMPDDHPDGDMVGDGIFELALRRLEAGARPDAIAILEKGLARDAERPERAYHSAGRFAYFLGRALLESGNKEKEARGLELLEKLLGERPLSYYMALAHARLAERDPGRAAKLLEELAAKEEPGEFTIPRTGAMDAPGFRRALELVRQDEVDRAKAELDALGVSRRTAPAEIQWAAAAMLAEAGAYRPSHAWLRGATSGAPGEAELWAWANHYPAGRWRKPWELAFPRPHAAIVSAEAKRNNIPEALAYAIMREESAFDPRVVSSADAVGLMQLILPTAERMAKPLGIKVDAEALKRPEINIALGCRYLGLLRGMFPDSPLLAIPGYNAGEGRPKRWISERPTQDFDLWVERIPYLETRNYTKRVLTSMAAYEFLAGAPSPEALRTPLRASPSAYAAASAPAPSAAAP